MKCECNQEYVCDYCRESHEENKMNEIKIGSTIKCTNKFGKVIEGKVREINEKENVLTIQTRKGYGTKFILEINSILK